jgi:hypothetical protein
MPWPLDPPPASEREIGQDDGLGGSNVAPYVPSPTSRMHERAMQTAFCVRDARVRSRAACVAVGVSRVHLPVWS